MKYDSISRRYFLQGLGGSLLTLPVLPSLLPKAHAQSITINKNLILIGSGHGGTGYNTDWYPAPLLNDITSSLLTPVQIFARGGENDIPHIARYALLKNILSANPGHEAGNVDMSKNRLSFILGSFMNPYLSKMNFFRGIDGGMAYYGHSPGVMRGNIWANSSDSNLIWPTIDQFLAQSKSFYKDRSLISLPVFNSTEGGSWLADGNPAPQISSRLDLTYDAIFSKYDKNQSSAIVAQRARREFLIDRVYDDYQRIIKGAFGPARQISSSDKLRLEQHVDMLQDVQKKYINIVNSCSEVSAVTQKTIRGLRKGGDLTEYEAAWDLTLDLLSAAIQCGATQLASIGGGINATYPGDYHQDVAHNGGDRKMEVIHNTNFRWQAEHIVTGIVKRLDAVKTGDGNTLLDNSLVLWCHEAGYQTHQKHTLGLVTFGGLGGYFKTGHYLDYRNMENLGLMKFERQVERRPGFPVQRLWANIVQAMGADRSEFERGGRPGYGDTTKKDPNGQFGKMNPYPTRILNSMSDKLPIIT